MTVQDDLSWALAQYTSPRWQNYKLYRRYYEGQHELAFATEKFRTTFGQMFKEFSENACRTVVDSLADRLKITGFETTKAAITKEQVQIPLPTPASPQIPGGQLNRQKVTVQDPLADQLWKIWKDNKMNRKATKVHKEAMRLGDSYVIVWPQADGEPGIWPQRGDQCCVRYDDETGDQIELGSKIWYDDREKMWYCNLYYPDAPITKFRMSSTQTANVPTFSAHADRWEVYEEVDNPYGRVPLFHFPNAATCEYGYSELKDIIPCRTG